MKDAVNHRWGADYDYIGPIYSAEGQKEGRMGLNRLDVAFMTNTDRYVQVFERPVHNFTKKKILQLNLRHFI